MAGLSGFKTLLQTPTDETKAAQATAPAAADFSTIGGFQSVDSDGSASEIDVTNQSSGEYREILDGRGVRSLDINCSGVLQNTAIAKALEANQFSQKLRWFRIVQEDDSNRTKTAKFKITSFSKSSAHDGSVNFSMSLMSSGPVTIA